MKDKHFFSVLASLMLISVTVNAQDVITLRSGDEIQAKITEVTPTEIKYKRFDNPDGPTFTINKSDAFMLKYENGTKDVFNEEPAQKVQAKNDDDEPFWNPRLYTNQHPAALLGYVDLGGFVMSGGKIGFGARWRRLEADIFWKSHPSKFYWGLGGDYDGDPTYELESLTGSGFGTNIKVLLPSPNSNTVVHVGILNEISDLEYVYAKDNSGRVSDSWQTSYYSTGLGGGFSHYTESGLFFRASAYFGVSVGIGNYYYEHNWNDGGHTGYWTDRRSWVDFFGTIEATIGFEIPMKQR